MVKFEFLEQFPVDQLLYSVVPIIIIRSSSSIYSFENFFLYQRWLKVTPLSLSDCKSLQVSSTLLRVQADLINTVV